eukprot:5231987-Pyramimonas_sp.AAC.1
MTSLVPCRFDWWVSMPEYIRHTAFLMSSALHSPLRVNSLLWLHSPESPCSFRPMRKSVKRCLLGSGAYFRVGCVLQPR